MLARLPATATMRSVTVFLFTPRIVHLASGGTAWAWLRTATAHQIFFRDRWFTTRFSVAA
jgi:hypothetical protein